MQQHLPPPMPPTSPAFAHHHPGHPQAPMSSGGAETSVAARMAPYSPVVWNRHHEEPGQDVALDDAAEPVPMAEWKDRDDDGHNDAVLQTAADAAAAFINSNSNHHDFPLLSGDDIPDASSLNLDELG